MRVREREREIWGENVSFFLNLNWNYNGNEGNKTIKKKKIMKREMNYFNYINP